MNSLDLIIIIALSIGFFLGWKLRAIHLLGMILSLCLGIWIANHYHHQLLELFHSLPPSVALVLAWLTLFLISVISISIVVSFIAKAFEVIRLKWLDRLLGASLAVTFVSTLLIIFLLVVNTMAKSFNWKIVDQSVFAKPILSTVQPMLQKRFHKYPKIKHILI